MGSIKSKKCWTAMLNWLHELAMVKPLYINNITYKTYLGSLSRLYPHKADPRLPFKLKHLLSYFKYHNANIKNIKYIKFDLLVSLLAILLYFFCMIRPCEISHVISSNQKLGIKLRHIKRIRKSNNIPFSYCACIIHSHKTMYKSSEPKYIYITDTACDEVRNGLTNKCNCYYLNPYRYLNEYLSRRSQLFLNHSTLNTANPNNILLVWENGKSLTTRDLSNITKQLVSTINIDTRDASRYSSYSYRIGGTTLAVALGINHHMILKYVGWSGSYLSDSSTSYIRPETHQLITIPFTMIHNNINHHSNLHNSISFMQQGLVFDPWSKQALRKRNTFSHD